MPMNAVNSPGSLKLLRVIDHLVPDSGVASGTGGIIGKHLRVHLGSARMSVIISSVAVNRLLTAGPETLRTSAHLARNLLQMVMQRERHR